MIEVGKIGKLLQARYRESPCIPCFRISRFTVHRVVPLLLTPDLAYSAAPFARNEDALGRRERFGVPLEPVRRFSKVAEDGGIHVSGRQSDRQDAPNLIGSLGLATPFNESDHLRNERSSSAWQNRPTPTSESRWRGAVASSRTKSS